MATVKTVAGNSLGRGNPKLSQDSKGYASLCVDEYLHMETINAYIESILDAAETRNPTMFFDIDYKRTAIQALESLNKTILSQGALTNEEYQQDDISIHCVLEMLEQCTCIKGEENMD